jgi:hypothetical protein
MISDDKKKWLNKMKQEYTGGAIPEEMGLYLQEWLLEQNIRLTGCSLIDNPVIQEFDV